MQGLDSEACDMAITVHGIAMRPRTRLAQGLVDQRSVRDNLNFSHSECLGLALVLAGWLYGEHFWQL